MYLKRIKYGIGAAKPRGKTLDGSHFSFKDGIGNPNNYEEISLIKFVILSTYSWILINLFKTYYDKLVKNSWRKNHNGI